MSNTTLSGYAGLFKQPVPKPVDKYITSIYFATNIHQDTIVLAALTPSSFKDLTLLAGLQQFKNIVILTTAIDALFISDILNTVMLTREMKKTIKWVFPIRPTIPTSVEFELAQEVASEYILYGEGNHEVFDIKFEYILSNLKDRSFYDIKITDGITTKYLCSYLSEEKLNSLYTDKTIDEFHVPLTSTIYGGLSFLEANALDAKYHRKMVANSFVNTEEYHYCITKGYKMGEVKIYDLI